MDASVVYIRFEGDRRCDNFCLLTEDVILPISILLKVLMMKFILMVEYE